MKINLIIEYIKILTDLSGETLTSKVQFETNIRNYQKIGLLGRLVDGLDYFDTTDEVLFPLIRREIKIIEERLLTRPIISNSTDKLRNLISEWEIDSHQEILKFFKSILDSEKTK